MLKKTKPDSATGILIGQAGDKVVSTDAKNVIAFGAPATGKSKLFVLPNILNAISQEKSIVVADPKGELYLATAQTAKENGYTVKQVDFANPEISDKINPLQNTDEIHNITETILANSFGGKNEAFFDASEANLLNALLLYVSEEDGPTLGKVYDILQEIVKNDGNYEPLDHLPKDKKAYPYWIMFKGAGRLRMNFAVGLALRLQSLIGNARDVLEDGIDLSQLRKEKLAIYVSLPITTNYKVLTSLVMSAVYNALLSPGRDVCVMMDELPMIGVIPNLRRLIQTNGTHTIMSLQEKWQLQDLYKKESGFLIEQCALVTTGTNDMDTAALFGDVTRAAIDGYKILFKDKDVTAETDPYDTNQP